jgi:GT2 family glycosyltransferase
MIKLSIVIVHYKTPQLLNDCITSIVQSKKSSDYEIIIVDNNSEDSSEEVICLKYPFVKWVNMGYNSGFARANNMGVKQAEGNYILLLNSDTVILDNAIDKSLDFFIQNEVKLNFGILGCQLLNEDSTIQFSSSLKFPLIKKLLSENDLYCFLASFFFNTRITHSLFEISYESHKTKWLGGAFILFNADLCHKEGIWLDEDFFMYCEDMEWSYRITKRKYNVFYFSEAKIIHKGGASSLNNKNKLSQIILSEWLFILKSRGKLYLLIYFLLEFLNGGISVFFVKNKSYEQNLYIRLKKELLLKYFSIILFNYKKANSSSQKSLITTLS